MKTPAVLLSASLAILTLASAAVVYDYMTDRAPRPSEERAS